MPGFLLLDNRPVTASPVWETIRLLPFYFRSSQQTTTFQLSDTYPILCNEEYPVDSRDRIVRECRCRQRLSTGLHGGLQP